MISRWIWIAVVILLSPLQAQETKTDDVAATYSLNFNNVDAAELVRHVGKIARKNFIFEDADLSFKVSAVSVEPTSVDNIMTMLLHILRIHNLSLLEQGNTLIVHKNEAVAGFSDIVSDDDQGFSTKRSGLVTRLFRVHHVSLQHLKGLLEPFMSKAASLEVSEETGHLVITDIRGNVEKIEELIESLDVPSSATDLGIYRTRHLSASLLSGLVEQILSPLKEQKQLRFIPQDPNGRIYILGSPYLIKRSQTLLRSLDVNAAGQAGTRAVPNLEEYHFVLEDWTPALSRLSRQLKALGPEDSLTWRKALVVQIVGLLQAMQEELQRLHENRQTLVDRLEASMSPQADLWVDLIERTHVWKRESFQEVDKRRKLLDGLLHLLERWQHNLEAFSSEERDLPSTGSDASDAQALLMGNGEPTVTEVLSYLMQVLKEPELLEGDSAKHSVDAYIGLLRVYLADTEELSDEQSIVDELSRVLAHPQLNEEEVEDLLYQLSLLYNDFSAHMLEERKALDSQREFERQDPKHFAAERALAQDLSVQLEMLFRQERKSHPIHSGDALDARLELLADIANEYWQRSGKGEPSQLEPTYSDQKDPKASAAWDEYALPKEHLDSTQFILHKINYQDGEVLTQALVDMAKGFSEQSNADLRESLKNVQFISPSNSLLFSGTSRVLRKVQSLLETLDVPKRQVFIEMLILRTSVNHALEFGLQFGAQVNRDGVGGSVGTFQTSSNMNTALQNLANNGQVTAAQVSNLVSGQTGLNVGGVGRLITHQGKGFTSLGALVKALGSDTDTDILLNPQLMAEDNYEAKMFVGETLRTPKDSIGLPGSPNTSSSFEIQDVGTAMKLLPHISGNGELVTLDIEQTLSRVAENAIANLTAGGTLTTKTQTTTRVHVPDGHFLILSGMVQDDKSRQLSRIPCLGAAPVIGSLFSSQNRSRVKNNIIIFIRPHVIQDLEHLEALNARKREDFTQKSDVSFDAFEWDGLLKSLSLRSEDSVSPPALQK